MVTEKARENRARRMADRQGLRLLKARSRDERAIDYGCYALADIETGGITFGVGAIGRYNASLDEIEEFLTSAPPRATSDPDTWKVPKVVVTHTRVVYKSTQPKRKAPTTRRSRKG